jgi:hypothetical protein
MAVGVLNAAQQWTALQKLELRLNLSPQQLQPGFTLDYCSAGILSVLPALKQLRHLDLGLPDLGACSVGQLGQAVQLTALELFCTDPAAEGTPVDLLALSRLTNLEQLVFNDGPAVHPAAGPAGPFCFPSSLTHLCIAETENAEASAVPLACCVTHLPGCPQLQELRLFGAGQQHHSVHPQALVVELAQHNRQLRSLSVWWGGSPDEVTWSNPVARLPDAAGALEWQWRPDAALAALTGLEDLGGGRQLCIRDQGDWQHLAQLSALSKLRLVRVYSAPPAQAGVTLRVVDLQDSQVHLGGHDVGQVLLACPLLQSAVLWISRLADATMPPAGIRLAPHPSLRCLELGGVSVWGVATATHFGALAPVLSGVVDLRLVSWPLSSTSQNRGGLPDLSLHTALTRLAFASPLLPQESLQPPEQEDFLSMVAPLKQLRRLSIRFAPRLNARAAVPLQLMLPQLQHLELWRCGEELPLAAEGAHRQQQEEILSKVKQLLRPGLQLAWSP